MSADFPFIFWWWLVLFALGITFFPFTASLFGRFIDRGYPFAKVVGILLLTYGFFAGAHAKFLTLTSLNLLLLWVFLTVVFLGVSRYFFAQTFSSLVEFVRKRWKLLVFEELLFVCCLTFWSIVRGFAPEIRGLEKFMDFGFINAILAGKTLPPLDMWLTKAPDFKGYFINYYYFGHLYSAVLTRLSNIDSSITYNLLVATLFAFTFVGGFSLGANLRFLLLRVTQTANDVKGSVFAGIITAFLLSLAGNLHAIYLFTKGYPNDNPVPFWEILSGFNPNSYWYPNATRFIHNTIHEFPIYSFVVSDLHGHVLDIPFVLLALALLLHITTREYPVTGILKDGVKTVLSTLSNKGKRKKQKMLSEPPPSSPLPNVSKWFTLVFLGLLMSVMFMTNAWDGIIYLTLTGLVLLYVNYRELNMQPDLSSSERNFKVFLQTLFQGAIVAAGFIFFALPFFFTFVPFANKLGIVCPPTFLSEKTIGPLLFEEAKTHCDRSPVWMLGVLWGFFIYNILGFVFFVVIPALRKKVSSFDGDSSRLTPIDVFVLLLCGISLFLLIFPEFFYAKDIYPLHYRANTMFKLGYQAFMMLQIAGCYIFFRILFSNPGTNDRSKRYSFLPRLITLLWMIGFFFCFYLVGVYPYFAIKSYYGNLQVYKGLDGLAWMHDQYGDDYNAVIWLRKQIESCTLSERHANPNAIISPLQSSLLPQVEEKQTTVSCLDHPVIAEAVGDSYTDYARVSANTGLPTIIGWPVHEWLWRGKYDEPGRRIPFVETIYTSKNAQEVLQLLNKYNVSYVFVGTLERQKYPALTEGIFQQLGSIVFQSGSTRIYRIMSK